MQFKTPLTILTALLAVPAATFAADFQDAATSTNQFGLELFRQVSTASPRDNLVLSPYSIESALAMAYAGAEADTRSEMARVLHFPSDDAPLTASFAGIRAALDTAVQRSMPRVGRRGQRFGPADSIEWHVANRLFGQKDYPFHDSFLQVVSDAYAAPLQLLDFKTAAEPARVTINAWVEAQTKSKIRDLIPSGGVDDRTRLVLVNALYFKAPWAHGFDPSHTQASTFKVHGTQNANLPTMRMTAYLGYAKLDSYTALTLSYQGGDLQFLILLPDNPTGVDALAAMITPELLHANAKLSAREVVLSLPKFKLTSPSIALSKPLRALGLKLAFSTTEANFNRIAPSVPNDGVLHLDEVFHKTFISLDEHGTEAAAATAATGGTGGFGVSPPPPIIMNVDHPFLFAIQDRQTGVCLFFGRVTDPR